jgi:hypothetical protein
VRRDHWRTVIHSWQLKARALKRLERPRRIHRRYSKAFALYREVANDVETYVRSPRRLGSPLPLALDMLMMQGYKTFLSLYLLTEHAQIEDAATIVRRLLELAARANWIAAAADEAGQEERARHYISDMLFSLQEGQERGIPSAFIDAWTELLGAAHVDASARRKRPKRPQFRQMFEAAGQLKTYDTDYAFLSAIAHGSPDNQILQYSARPVRLNQDAFVPVLLLYGTRYYVALFGIWNSEFHVCPKARVDTLIELVDVSVAELAA